MIKLKSVLLKIGVILRGLEFWDLISLRNVQEFLFSSLNWYEAKLTEPGEI